MSDREIVQAAMGADSPIIVCTDGGSKRADPKGEAAHSAAVVICRLDIREGETFESGQWQKRTPVPLLVRIKLLPKMMGTSETDNGHAEIIAMNMAEELLPKELPAVIATDSEVTMGRYRTIRDGLIGSERNLIRNILSGVSKANMRRLFRNISQWSVPAHDAYQKHKYEDQIYEDEYEEDEEMLCMLDEYGDYDRVHLTNDDFEEEIEDWRDIPTPEMDINNPPPHSSVRSEVQEFPQHILGGKTVRERMKAFVEAERQWITEDDSNSPWKRKYYDNHPHRIVIKIDSHQLTDEHERTGRYPKITPNRAMVAGNQHVDTAASMGIGKYENECIKTIIKSRTPKNITNDPHGLRFYITYDGMAIDKSIPKFIQHIFSKEMLNRYAQRGTQGLIARIKDEIHLTPAMIGQRGTMNRVIMGKATTHSQKVYRNTVYATHHAMRVDGIMHKDDIPKEKGWVNRKRKGIYTLCPFCTEYPACQPCQDETDRSIESTVQEGQQDNDKRDESSESSDRKEEDDGFDLESIEENIENARFGPKGDMRHYMVFCNNEKIFEHRKLTLGALEKALERLINEANEIADEVGVAKRLDDVWHDTMIQLEREEHIIAIGEENKSKKELRIDKRPNNASYGGKNKWDLKISETTDVKRAAVMQTYPWTHRLGFVGLLEDGELKVQHANVADVMYLGYIPKKLHEAITKYCARITNKYSEIDEEEAKIKRKELARLWAAVRGSTFVRTESMAKVIRQAINEYGDELERKYKPKEVDGKNDPDADLIHNTDENVTDPLDDNEKGGQAKVEKKKKAEKKNPQHRCQGDHCIAARNTSLDAGMVQKKGTLCRRCNTFDDCTKIVTKIEKKMETSATSRAEMADILRTIEGESNTARLNRLDDTIEAARSLNGIWPKYKRKDDGGKRINRKPKVKNYINHLAKTLAIPIPGTSHYKGPDPAINNEEAMRMLQRAKCICKCAGKRDRPTRTGATLGPKLCDDCSHVKPYKSQNETICRGCCKQKDPEQPPTEDLCRGCQVYGLVRNNNMKSRFAHELEIAISEGCKDDDITKAKKLVEQNEYPNYPGLMPVDKELSSGEAWQRVYNKLGLQELAKDDEYAAKVQAATILIKRKAKSETYNPGDTNKKNNRERQTRNNEFAHAPTLADGTSQYFHYPPITKEIRIGDTRLNLEVDLPTLEVANDMGGTCLQAILQLIADKHTEAHVISTYFFPHLRVHGWDYVANYLKRVPTNNKILIIPIHTGEDTINRHWSIIIRIKKDEGTGYCFYYLDSLNSQRRYKIIQGVLAKKGRRTKNAICSKDRGDTFTMISCCPQENRECGPLAVLNTAIALEDTNNLGYPKHEMLKRLDNIEALARAWIKKSLITGEAISTDWIKDMFDQRGTDKETSPRKVRPSKKVDTKNTPKKKEKRSYRKSREEEEIYDALISESTQHKESPQRRTHNMPRAEMETTERKKQSIPYTSTTINGSAAPPRKKNASMIEAEQDRQQGMEKKPKQTNEMNPLNERNTKAIIKMKKKSRKKKSSRNESNQQTGLAGLGSMKENKGQQDDEKTKKRSYASQRAKEGRQQVGRKGDRA